MPTRIEYWLQEKTPPKQDFVFSRFWRAIVVFLSAFMGVKKIAIDMDGPIIEFDPGWQKKWDRLWPELKLEPADRENRLAEYDLIAKYGYDRIAEVFGEKLIREEYDESKSDNKRKTLIMRALRTQALNIINKSGFLTNLKPNKANVEQVKRILDMPRGHRWLCPLERQIYSGKCWFCRLVVDSPKYEVFILSALPEENHAGFAEKRASLKKAFGEEYFHKFYNIIIVQGRKTHKGDMNWDIIFEDNTNLQPRMRFASGLHIIVETDHNRNYKPRLFQKYAPKGSDWIEVAGL